MSDEASSTDTSSSTELKAGHAPALKVGGMRVSAPRPRHTSHGEEKTSEGGQETSGEKSTESGANAEENEKPDEVDDEDEQATGAVANRAAGQMVGGKYVPIQKAFPTEAVKNIHDKPGTHPKHEHHTHAKHNDIKFINQPGLQ